MPASADDARYHAGLVDGRLEALERHSLSVNGTIERTGDALTALTISVQGLATTLSVLDLTGLEGRVLELEKEVRVLAGQRAGIALSGRVLAAVVVTLATVISTVIVLANIFTSH